MRFHATSESAKRLLTPNGGTPSYPYLSKGGTGSDSRCGVSAANR